MHVTTITVSLHGCTAQEGADAPPALAEAAAALATAQAEYDAELGRVFAPPGDTREEMRRAAERGLDAAIAALGREHAALAEAERETTRILNHRFVVSAVPVEGSSVIQTVGLDVTVAVLERKHVTLGEAGRVATRMFHHIWLQAGLRAQIGLQNVTQAACLSSGMVVVQAVLLARQVRDARTASEKHIKQHP